MTIARKLFAALLALLIAAPTLAQAQRTYSQPELDQMLAPIALYPDPLLAQVLMAATYPLEVAAAARWSRANPGLQGDDAVRAVEYEDWDPSVKSLVAFPQLLARMDENPDWTRRLGEAFLAQEPHVMDTVQQLRRRARAAGQLASDERLVIVERSSSLAIQPLNPQVVYVPYYDPRIVYGPWWWPAYQPIVWTPWPGYARPYRPGVSVGFWWGRPVNLSVNFFFGNFDWHHRHVRVVHPTVYYRRPPVALNRTVVVAPHRWQHEPRQRATFYQRRERQQSRPQSNALPSVQVRPPVQGQPQPRARMPEAVAPQQPRAERHAPRHEPRNERLHKGGDRS
ncbi:MAG: hypothetical protein A2W21_15280 [Betaproteobacteria bacterium RBG_16_66_20]|nr:MAG: hypothetical protein A2W21_15280 [Betaproteobacteria bacterium RBG_16_66_20]